MAEPRILPSADLDDGIQIGDGSSIWHLAQVRGGAEIGENVIVGRGAYIGSGVHVGDNCKIQNYALVYEPAHLEDGVFIGPAASPVTFPPTRWWPECRPGASNGWVVPVFPSRKPVPTHSVTRTPATSSNRWARPSTS